MDAIVQVLGYFNTPNEELVKKIKEETPNLDKNELLQKRKKHIGSKCQIFYEKDPFVVSSASMQYLYDEQSKRFLDCISNVQHVGHCHSTVVGAITQQMLTSTCNVRFVSGVLGECAEQLLKTLPGLDTVLFCNSGSEANDLALRLARDFTHHQDMVVLDHAYHGHVTSTMQMSPYKFDHGCTIQKPDWVHVAPVPDVYRGNRRLDYEHLNDSTSLHRMGQEYANDVSNILEEAAANGRKVAGFIAEALQSCGGQIIPPPEYLKSVASHIHLRGGLLIIDEVQTGFGRIGQSFWAHQLHKDGLVPDIVTMGKPMGNGFPVAAVVTRKEIADQLGGQPGYFNTYGGNPVACAAVLGVLKVIKDENLLEHSHQMGALFEKYLNDLKEKHQCVGDVRGVGMFWGIDLVKSRETREPNTELARQVILTLRQEYGVLLNADGPHTNILKFKPPLCFNVDDLKMAVDALDKALTQLSA